MTGYEDAILLHLLAATLAGGLVGLERTYHGRPAGFRTHTLVCTASSLLMLLTTYQAQWMPAIPADIVRVDPARMGQGIMTGIGFLGAGVIMRDGLTIRGLTTAASIWMTASIGILIGVGFYFPAIIATVLTLVTLSLFRWIETAAPTLSFGRLRLRFPRASFLPEAALAQIVARHGIGMSGMSYRLTDGGRHFEYEMTIRARAADAFRRLAETLATMDQVEEFAIVPTGEK